MFRIAPQAARHTQHRFFVSSVLLTRAWENESVSDLKRELKERGLSRNGNKSTLITRIQEHERFHAITHNPSVPFGTRTTSTGVSPGIPSQSIRETHASSEFTNINLPDISQPDLETDVQIPFVPDFWESSPAKILAAAEPPLPKLLIVAGADTHHGGGPSHNLHDEHHPHTDVHVDSSARTTTGFWQDVAQDIGVPTNILKDTQRAVFDHIPDTSGTVSSRHSRTLDKDETKGVWVLFGLLAGSWILGGVVNERTGIAHSESTEKKE
jgi:hypothetical protein